MERLVYLVLSVAACGLLQAQDSLPPPRTVSVTVEQQRIGIGRSVTVRAVARQADGSPVAGCELLPYVNGRRWGSHEKADQRGEAVFHIPLPRAGATEIRVAVLSPMGEPDDFWIWHGPQNVAGSVWI